MIKKILSALLCGAMIFTVVGCSSNDAKDDNKTPVVENSDSTEESSVNIKEVIASVLEKQYIPMPMEADDTMATDMYHLNLEDVEEYGIAETGRSPGVGFVAIAKAKEGKLESVQASFEKIKEDKIANAFYPDEIETAKNLTVETVGNIVYMSVFYDNVNEEAQKLIKDALSK